MNAPLAVTPIGVRPIPRAHLEALLDKAANDRVREADQRAAERLAAGDWREELLAALRQPPPPRVSPAAKLAVACLVAVLGLLLALSR